MPTTDNSPDSDKAETKSAIEWAKQERDKADNEQFKKRVHDGLNKISQSFQRMLDIFRKHMQKDSEHPYLLLIGGGEIGVEIGLAAREAGWYVRAIVDEKEDEPIQNLPYYQKGDFPRIEKFITSGKEPNFFDKFLCVKRERPYKIEELVDVIRNFRPDFVVLEDPFLSASEWSVLCSKVSQFFKDGMPHFIPSPVEGTQAIENASQSEIFLDKKTMKEFLEKIELGKCLLGSAKMCINIANLRKEVGGENIEGPSQLQIVEQAFKIFGGGDILFKPAQTSSGHGQFKISKPGDLTTEFVNAQLKYYDRSKRAHSDTFLLEHYVANKIETCLIKGAESANDVVISGIWYKKYGEESSLDERYKGMSRLAWSFTKSGRKDFLSILHNRARDIIKVLRVPYLHVEFIIDLDNKKEYINEISYRPDDAGFITVLSNRKDQFKLFIESLSVYQKGLLEESRSLATPADEPESYSCETLIPLKDIRFEEISRLTHEYPLPESKVKDRKNSRLRLYQKTLELDAAENVKFGRIIGYMWHRPEEDGKELLRGYIKFSDIPPKTVQRLVDALPERAGDLEKALSFVTEET